MIRIGEIVELKQDRTKCFVEEVITEVAVLRNKTPQHQVSLYKDG